MDRRVESGWPTRVAANELPLEAAGQYYRRAVAEPVAEYMSVEKAGACAGRQLDGGDSLRQKQCYVIVVQSLFQSVFSLPRIDPQ